MFPDDAEKSTPVTYFYLECSQSHDARLYSFLFYLSFYEINSSFS